MWGGKKGRSEEVEKSEEKEGKDRLGERLEGQKRPIKVKGRRGKENERAEKERKKMKEVLI